MIDRKYELRSLIGIGGSSKVFSAVNTLDSSEYAIKAIRKDKGYTKELAVKLIELEVQTMLSLGSHPNIVNIIDSNAYGVARLPKTGYEEVKYIVLEKCTHGSLSKYIKKTGPLEAELSKFMFSQLWNAVAFMHHQHYVHLDIKLDNILLDDFFNLKLADLGIALCAKGTSGYIAHRRGTPKYMAAEVENSSDKAPFNVFKADIFSLGVCLHLLVFGEYPTNEETVSDCSEDTNMSSDEEQKKGFGKEKSYYWVPEECKELIEWMLHTNPKKRPTIDQILSHPWMASEMAEDLPQQVYLEMLERTNFMQGPKVELLPF